MIERLNSQELNNIMHNSLSEIERVKRDYANMEQDIINKVGILQMEAEYKEELLNIDRSQAPSNKLIFADSSLEREGEYEIFGHTVHPKVAGSIVDIFNSQFEDKVLYKNNAAISINDSQVSNGQIPYKNYLMHPGARGKRHFIDKFSKDELTINIEMDNSTILGSAQINTIEIDPFLQGSFDIKDIRFYSATDSSNYKSQGELRNVTKSRVMLKDSVSFSRVAIDIKLHYKDSNDFYLFGLKSLRFLNVPYSKDSFVIAKLEKPKDIKRIGNKISMKGPTGSAETTIYDEGIIIYLDNKEGLLSYEVEPGITGKAQDIARNTNTVYFKIPLRSSLTSIHLKDVNLKEGI